MLLNRSRYRMDSPPPVSTPDGDTDIPLQYPSDNIDISDMENDIAEAGRENIAVEELASFTKAYMEHGEDRVLTAYGIRRGYLANTAMALYGLESINEESIICAQEGLMTAVKDKIASWLERLIPTLKKTGSVITGFITRQLAKLADLAKSAASSTVKTVKTHPVATILTALTACAGVAAAAPAMMRLIPTISASLGRAGATQAVAGAAQAAEGAGAKASAQAATGLIGRLQAIISRIKSPFSKFTIKPKGKGFSLDIEKIPLKTVKGNPAEMGWTKTAISSIMNKLSGLKSLAPNLTELAQGQYTKEVTEISGLWNNKNYIKMAASLGFKALVYVPFLTLGWEVVVAAFKLVKEVVWGTLRLIGHAFAALTGHSEKKDLETEGAQPSGV